MINTPIKVVELFAGVGGFRLGLEKSHYKIVWSNQWEPGTKIQYASDVYISRFGKDNHSNVDIANVQTNDIPDHDLLCGGFPCQDYSVATTLHNSKGLKGKKGVLWWSIHRILEEKKHKPKYLLLENVDRLLKSPANQKGRDFAVMLQSLNQLGYAIEWRVINAAEYGMPQRRRRVFFIGYHETSDLYKELKQSDKFHWMNYSGAFAKSFPIQESSALFCNQFNLKGDLVQITNNFNIKSKQSPFENTGVMINSTIFTIKTEPNYHGPYVFLRDVLQQSDVDDEFYIDKNDYSKWEYLKGSKTIQRISSEGFKYNYSEGSMSYPDVLDKPSRTIITGEGGKSPSRFKHVIRTEKGLRRLTPIELERLNMFPDNHTKISGISNSKRAFLMGNALVVGIIEKIGKILYEKINNK